MSEKGYSSQVIGKQWMQTVFDPQTKDIADGRTRLLIVDGHSSHFSYELLDYASTHDIIVICLPPHTTHALQTLDVLGFAQFKRYYAQILDDRAHDGFGSMNKRAFLQAIKEPFIKAFTVENIKKSFEIVGLHPFNPSVIKASKMAPSIPTSTNPLSLADEPSPVKAMKTAFADLLDDATLAVPSFPSLHLEPDPSSSTPVPPAMHSMTTGYSTTVPKADTSEPLPQKLAQTLLQGTSAAWIVSDNPVTSSAVFKPYCTPSEPSIKLDMPPHAPLHNPLELTAENAALREHIDKLNHIIASQRVQLTLNSLAVQKLKHQLYEKEQRVKDRKGHHLLDGKVQIATAPEFQKLVKDIQEKKSLEKKQKEARAEERKKKADANAALQHLKAQQIERYNEDMASYQEECATLAADGVPKKFWPKKPTHPTRGRKANQSKLLSHDSPHPPIPTTPTDHTATPANLIVDLDGDPEDSEYEDFED